MSISQYPIRPYLWWFQYVPVISSTGFNTLFTDTIYLSRELYIDAQKTSPNPVTIAIIKHQEVHAHGASLWKAVRFVCSSTFRLQEETLAYKAQFNYLKKHHLSWDLGDVARQFTTIRYLWVMSYADAHKFIQEVWDNV